VQGEASSGLFSPVLANYLSDLLVVTLEKPSPLSVSGDGFSFSLPRKHRRAKLTN
jgi:hypothetical protein